MAVSWTGSHPAHPPRLLLVSSEDASTSTFQEYLTSLSARKRLARIVVDEVHLYLGLSEFRKGFRGVLSLMAAHEVPHLFLTATLPPHLELSLCHELGVKVPTVRGDSHRKNLAWSVTTTRGTSDMRQAAVRMTEERIREYEREERAIIFVMGRSGPGTLKEMFEQTGGVGIYHSDLSGTEKDEAVRKWREGGTTVMIATSGFGLGLDYPRVRDVVIVGATYSMMDLAQLGGRGGRDPTTQARITVVTCNGYLSGIEEGGDPAFEKVKAWIVDDTSCRRQVLETYLDGKPAPCCVLAAATPCDICESKAAAIVVFSAPHAQPVFRFSFSACYCSSSSLTCRV